MVREDSGMSISTPPFFNKADYGYWKSQMEIFLNAYKPRVWNAIVDGYTQPDKLRSEWTPAKADAHKVNFRALNAIVSGLAPDEFRRIAHLKSIKEVQKLLSIIHEDTSAINVSKL